jgi:hypothetical protein
VTDFLDLLETQLVDAHARRRRVRLPVRRASGAIVLAAAAAAAVAVLIVALASPNAAREPAVAPSPAAPPAAAPPAAKSPVVVSVLNATRKRGLARVEAVRLVKAGYRMAVVGDAPGPRRERSVVYYAHSGRTAALVLARRERIARVDGAGPTIRRAGGRASVIVVLGADHPR